MDRLAASALLLGIGLGAFIDGILLHQILQWHHMVSSAGIPPDTLANLRINVLADGIFHAVAWLITAAGLILLWSHSRQRQDAGGAFGVLFGGLLAGWGVFNLVEGVVNHFILGIHHVREGVANEMAWDVGFLIFSVVLLAAGWLLMMFAQRQAQ